MGIGDRVQIFEAACQRRPIMKNLNSSSAPGNSAGAPRDTWPFLRRPSGVPQVEPIP